MVIGVLLVTTGYPRSSETKTTELIPLDPEHSNEKCSGPFPPSFPAEVSSATGGLLLAENALVVCGGIEGEGNGVISDKCYAMTSQNKNHTNQIKMTTPRVYAASIAIDGKLFVTGGYEPKSGGLSSTEYVGPLGGPNAGPDLPVKLYHHCFARLNQTTAFAASGLISPRVYSRTSYFFDISQESWTTGPDLKIGRTSAACGLVSNLAIVVGGRSPSVQSTTEILDLESNVWSSGPSLPSGGIYGASAVSFKGELFIIGGTSGGGHGASKSLLKLSCHGGEESCHWTTMDQKLGVARYFSVGILVPSSILDCQEAIKTTTAAATTTTTATTTRTTTTTASTTISTTTVLCIDTYAHCGRFKNFCSSSDNNVLRKACQKTCGLC